MNKKISENVSGDVIMSFLRQHEAGRNPVFSRQFQSPRFRGSDRKVGFSEIA